MNHDRDTLLERELRDTFDTLASGYTPVRLPHDLWADGRAERRTGRVRVLAAVAVIVALLGGLAALQQTSGALLPAKTSESGALPKNLYVPSAEEVAEIMARDPLSGLGYEGGRASIATLTSAGDVLLVSATTGEHHIISGLDIDLVQEDAGGNLPLALSPDGRMLAYAYRERSDDSIEEETGVGVIDLLEGGLGTVTLPLVAPDGLSIEVDDLAWSPDSSHVAWLGSEYVPGEGPTNEDTKWLGSGDANLGGARQWSLETKGTWPSEIVVDNRGRGFVIGDQAWPFGEDPDLSAISPSSGRAFPTDEDWFSMNDRGAALTSDGRSLLLGGPNATGGKSGATATHLEVDLNSPDLTSTRTDWPMDRDNGGTYLEMLGGTPGGSVVATQNFSPNSVEAVSPDGDFQRLTTIYGFTEASLTVATDLADADPVRFASPPWAPRPPLWPLVAGVLLVLAAMRIVVRRRRLRHSPDVADAVVNPPSSRAVPNAERTEPSAGRAVVAWGIILLVLLGTLTYVSRPWPTGESVRAADGSVPSAVHLPPDYLSLYDVEPSSLAVGRIGALAQSDGQPPVLVGAEDGRHHVVALEGAPDGRGMTTPNSPVLSPDGTRLAWTFNDEDDFVQTVDGLRIAELDTGEIEDVRIAGEGDEPLRIDEIAWSPSGAHVAWKGNGPRREKTSKRDKNRRSQQVGVVTSDDAGKGLAAIQWTLPDSASWGTAIAVDDSGRARLLAGRRLWTFPEPARRATDPASRRVADHEQSWTGAAISADGQRLVTGLNHGEGGSYSSGLMTLDLADDDSQMVTHPWRALPLGSGSRVLGWTPEGDVVVSHHVRDLHLQSGPEQVSVVTASGLATPLTGTDASHLALSVATDLASRATEFPEPVWPRSDERWWALGLLGVAALLAVLKLGQAVRRRHM